MFGWCRNDGTTRNANDPTQVSCSMQYLAIIISAAMFAFSGYMYSQTGDWVALVFMIGSGAYGLLFASGKVATGLGRNSSDK
ncbi:MAG: hypothetical protein P8Q31_01615 [Luminiphilus sp.]|nr:hypothetical protein [Luminiphilus sp.]